MRHPEEHNKLAVDPDTSWIIEKIFALAAHGAGAGKIARTLTSENIPAPGYFNYKKYGLFSKFYDNAPAEKACTWTISTVRGILSDETYIGNSVHGKQTTRLIPMKSNCYPDCLNQTIRNLQKHIRNSLPNSPKLKSARQK